MIALSHFKRSWIWLLRQDFELDGKVLPRCNPRQWLKSQDSEYLDAKCDLVIDSLESGEVTLVQNQPLGENRMGHQIRPQRILLRTSPRINVFQFNFALVAVVFLNFNLFKSSLLAWVTMCLGICRYTSELQGWIPASSRLPSGSLLHHGSIDFDAGRQGKVGEPECIVGDCSSKHHRWLPNGFWFVYRQADGSLR